MRKAFSVALIGLLPAFSSRAPTVKPDPLLNRFIGHWVLRGRMAGADVVHDVTCNWVLGSEYVEMHEVARAPAVKGKPPYEAIVYLVHDPHNHEYAAFWLDNTDYNAFYPPGQGHGVAAGDSIPFVFTYSPTSRMHTTFVYDSLSNTWQWHMDDEENGKRRVFARVTLSRK